MKKFKFELGDKVKHACDSDYSDSRIIIARSFQETFDGIREVYTVSWVVMGQINRITASMHELEKVEQKTK